MLYFTSRITRLKIGAARQTVSSPVVSIRDDIGTQQEIPNNETYSPSQYRANLLQILLLSFDATFETLFSILSLLDPVGRKLKGIAA